MAEKIRWSPKAADNLEKICEYISQDSEHYAAFFAQKVVAIIKNIPHFPKAGRIVPEYGNENLREIIFQNYRIVYRLKDDLIEIAAISHCAKQLEF